MINSDISLHVHFLKSFKLNKYDGGIIEQMDKRDEGLAVSVVRVRRERRSAVLLHSK